MALIPTLNLVTVAQDASTFTVQDATGAYSGSNPGGFKTPNPTQGAITGVLMGLYAFSVPTTIAYYRLLSLTALFATGEILAASSFTGVSAGTIYGDQVYGLKYNILYTGTGNIIYTSSSKQFTLTNAATVLAGAVGFTLAGNTSKIYYIDITKTLNSTSGWVTEALPVTGATVAFEVAYAGKLDLLISKAGEKCLTEDIAIWAQDGCKDDDFKDIWKRFKQQIALKSKFTQGYLNDANTLAISLASYCDCLTPSTICNC